MATLHYSSNNSGGGWWLTDQNWKDLEAAGWDVAWVVDKDDARFSDDNGRFLGALATAASIETDDVRASIDEFERVTGQNVSDQGCNCCGPPHSFSWEDNNGWDYLSNYVVTESRVDW